MSDFADLGPLPLWADAAVDDLARLALADHLEEVGESEAAAWLRSLPDTLAPALFARERLRSEGHIEPLGFEINQWGAWTWRTCRWRSLPGHPLGAGRDLSTSHEAVFLWPDDMRSSDDCLSLRWLIDRMSADYGRMSAVYEAGRDLLPDGCNLTARLADLLCVIFQLPAREVVVTQRRQILALRLYKDRENEQT